MNDKPTTLREGDAIYLETGIGAALKGVIVDPERIPQGDVIHIPLKVIAPLPDEYRVKLLPEGKVVFVRAVRPGESGYMSLAVVDLVTDAMRQGRCFACENIASGQNWTFSHVGDLPAKP